MTTEESGGRAGAATAPPGLDWEALCVQGACTLRSNGPLLTRFR